ncbi:uncharacterized protein [Macrobrachium rosenbergii]|uniref:uncharacterized protein n=1 Tax=Macrobrachium rosenbergii TaxID=79674 RepID=UPI0034D5B226
MLFNVVRLVLILVAKEASTEPANGYPGYDYSAYNPYYPSYSWPATQTPAYNPYGYQTYYPSTYPSQATQTGQPAYTYSSAYPSYPSYPTYGSYPFYYPYPTYPYYPFYPTQQPSVEPQTSPPPAGPVVWPTGKPKTTPRPAVWPTGSPTRPPSIPVWPTKKAPQTTTTTAPSWPTVKAETTSSPKKLTWPTEKSASPPTTPSTETPEKMPNLPEGPPKTGVTSVTLKWPTESPRLRGTTTPTGATQTPAAQTTRTLVWPTRSPKLPQPSRRISGVTPSPGSQVPVSRTGATKRPKVPRGKDRGEKPQRPTTSSRRKQKPKGRKPPTKPTRIPTISPVTTPIPFLPDEDAEIILGIPTYVPLVKVPGLPSNSTDLEPKLPPVDQDGPLASHNSSETSNAAGGTMTNISFVNSTEPAITSVTSATHASTHCKRLCLDARGKRFCCEHGTGRCPPKPESCYVPLSDPIPRHRSKGQCLVDTQCAENFKCCLDYCEEEYYCTRVQYEL